MQTGSTASPADVGSVPDQLRWNSGAPNAASAPASARDKAEGLAFSARAASDRLRASARAGKARIMRKDSGGSVMA